MGQFCDIVIVYILYNQHIFVTMIIKKTLAELSGPDFVTPQEAVAKLVKIFDDETFTSVPKDRPFDLIGKNNTINQCIVDVNYPAFISSLLIAKKKYAEHREKTDEPDNITQSLGMDPALICLFTETKKWYEQHFLPAIYQVYFSLDKENNFGADNIKNKLINIYKGKFQQELTEENITHFLLEKYLSAVIQNLILSVEKHSLIVKADFEFGYCFTEAFEKYRVESIGNMQAIFKQKKELEKNLDQLENKHGLSVEQKNSIKQGFHRSWQQGKLVVEKTKQEIISTALATKKQSKNFVDPDKELETRFKAANKNRDLQYKGRLLSKKELLKFHKENAINSFYDKMLEEKDNTLCIQRICANRAKDRSNEAVVRQEKARDMIQKHLFKNRELTPQEKHEVSEVIKNKEQTLMNAAVEQQQKLFSFLNEFSAHRGIILSVDVKGEVFFELPKLEDRKSLEILALTVNIAKVIACPQGAYVAKRPLTPGEGVRLFKQIEAIAKPYEANLAVFEGGKLKIFLGKAKLFLNNLFSKNRLPGYAKSFFLWQGTKNKILDILSLSPLISSTPIPAKTEGFFYK